MEQFEGQTACQGTVEVFDLIGHPKAKRAYAWTYRDGDKHKTIAVLEIPPVDSPQSAVKVAIASETKKSKYLPSHYQDMITHSLIKIVASLFVGVGMLGCSPSGEHLPKYQIVITNKGQVIKLDTESGKSWVLFSAGSPQGIWFETEDRPFPGSEATSPSSHSN